jgi:DNA-binding CsgD family transcriptional regulator
MSREKKSMKTLRREGTEDASSISNDALRIGDSSQLVSSETERRLRERIKELNCLYGLSRLVETHDTDLDAILQGLVELIPASWQFSEITASRIGFRGKLYQTANFQKTQWIQSAPIMCGKEIAGVLEVVYLEKVTPADEGPFLREERALINALAESLSRNAERIEYSMRLHRALRQIQVERDAMEETNSALRVVMTRFEEEKRVAGRELMLNIERVVMPILQMLYAESSPQLEGYLDLLKRSLEDICSPFVNNMSMQHINLSPTEIVICTMIRNGLTSKEIAKLRHISPVTVARHREHIRRKLGIANEKINLASYLQTIDLQQMS